VAAVAAGLGWGVLAVSGEVTLERLNQMDAEVDIEGFGRLSIYQVSLGLVGERPWLGHGYGNFEAAFATARDERFTLQVDKAHDTYIEHLVELGVPATLLLYLGPLLLFGWCIRGVFVRRRNQVFPLAAVGATLVVALHALVDFSLQIPAVAVTYAALLGIGVAQATPAPHRTRSGATLRE
jgi:O-antigen ligase